METKVWEQRVNRFGEITTTEVPNCSTAKQLYMELDNCTDEEFLRRIASKEIYVVGDSSTEHWETGIVTYYSNVVPFNCHHTIIYNSID